jgi:uncharacterized protein YndB with AHSA1/START domain
MADIVHDFPIKAPSDRVYQAVSTPAELDRWWTKRSSGTRVEGATYELWFGPQYDWRAEVTRCVPSAEFELRMVVADDDWRDTRVGFRLKHRGETTRVRFSHTWVAEPKRALSSLLPLLGPVSADPAAVP